MTISAGNLEQFVRLRHKFHASPELSGQENRTASTIAELLRNWGLEVHTDIGGNGVVGVLRRGAASKAIGLRADFFDALPIQEETGLSYSSVNQGKMHACGHDGHTAILLAAVHELARSPFDDGMLVAIFQPAEEIGQGAKAMFADEIESRFPVDAYFGLHNMPGIEEGQFAFREGRFWAAVDDVDITLTGFGGHGGAPHLARDPLVAGCHLGVALQSIVSRSIDPIEQAVVTIGAFQSGNAHNVIPNDAKLRLNLRSFSKETRDLMLRRITEVANGTSAVFGVDAEIELDHSTPAVVNDPAMTRFARQVALESPSLRCSAAPASLKTVSDDFSEFLNRRPGSYIVIGNGCDSHPLHHPKYDFNDKLIEPASTYWVALVREFIEGPDR